MDETQNIATTKTPRFYRDKSLLISVGLLIFSIIFFLVAPFAPIYWLRLAHLNIRNMLINETHLGLACLQFLIIVGLWFLAARFLIFHAITETTRIIIYCLVGLTTLVIIIGSIIGLIFVFGLGQRFLGSTELEGNRYHLEYWHGVDSRYYTLIQCNQFDLDCEIVKQFVIGIAVSHPPDTHLIADLETNTLRIIEEGNTIQTYTPQ